jgi:hypothetical protein
MSYKIDPQGYCIAQGCSLPKATGEDLCPLCLQTAYPEAATAIAPETTSGLETTSGPEAKPPRCIAYLSQAGDVITLELTGEPKFTDADVELVASALSRRRKAA